MFALSFQVPVGVLGPSGGGWHGSGLLPSGMPGGSGCCWLCPPATLSPLPPWPPHLRGCGTGRRLPSSSAGSHSLLAWAGAVSASLLGNKPGFAEGPKGLEVLNLPELHGGIPALMKLLAEVFLGSRQPPVFAPREAGTPSRPGASASQSCPKGWEGFFCFSLYPGKAVQKGCMEIITEFMDVAKHD